MSDGNDSLRSAVVEILSLFGAKVGLTGLSLDEDGFGAIGLDDLIVNVELRGAADAFAFYVRLGAADETRRAEVAIAMADGNYMLYGTQGATLGMNRAGDVVLTVQVVASSLTPVRFEQILANVVNISMAWRRRLFGGAAEEPASKFVPAYGIQG